MPFEQVLRLVHALLLQRGALVHLDKTYGLTGVQAWSERRVYRFLIIEQHERFGVASTRCSRQKRVGEA